MQKEGRVLPEESGQMLPCRCGEERGTLAPRFHFFKRDSEISTVRHAVIREWFLVLSQWELWSGLWTIFIKIAWECFIKIQIPGSYSRPAGSDLWGLGGRKQLRAIFMNSFQLKKYLRICLLPGDLNILTNEKIVYLFITILIPAHIYVRHASPISALCLQCLPAQTCHVWVLNSY